MMEKELKIGTKFKQIKAIEEYGFDYIGEEFEVTLNNGIVIVGKCYNKGVGFGIELDKFDTYFELIKEENNTSHNIKIGDIIRITNEIFKNVEGQVLSRTEENIENNTISIINNDDKFKNIITINIDDVKIIKPFKRTIHKENFDVAIDGYECKVKIRGFRTTVKIYSSNRIFKGSVYCNKNDLYNKEEGVERAFKKALIRLLETEVNN